MSLNKLRQITKNFTLANTDKIIDQGRAAFRAMFDLRSNPFKSDRDRKLWEDGYKAEEMKWKNMQRRWREAERGQNA